MDKQIQLQTELLPNQDPILTTNEIKIKCDPLENRLKDLLRRPLRPPPKPPVDTEDRNETIEKEDNDPNKNDRKSETIKEEDVTKEEDETSQNNGDFAKEENKSDEVDVESGEKSEKIEL